MLTSRGEETAQVHGAPSLAAGPPGPSRTSSSPGARWGRYLVMDELGRGGMGVVIRAYDPLLQREVAIKWMRTDVVSAESRERMLLEAQTMAKLSHPNIVTVYDAESIHGDVALVMEYVEGTTLGAWLEEGGGRRSWKDVLAAFIAAGRGIAAAHAAGVLHRDFKPANVLIGQDGRVRVTDFGIAKMHDRARRCVSTSAGEPGEVGVKTELTQAGDVLGSPRYMAPEQHAGDELGPSVDQYAYCVALFESLTGTRAFEASGDMLAEAKRRGAPRWPADVAVPRRIADAIQRGLEPSPELRWPTMDALLEALSEERKRRMQPWIVAASTAVVVGVSAMAWTSWRENLARRCSGGRAQIEAVWNAARRMKAEQAMLATNVPEAVPASEAALPLLDDYAASWVTAHRDACEATSVRGEQPVAVLDLKMACLHRAKVRLGAVAGVLERADARVIEKSRDVVGGLPALERCSDGEALKTDVLPPADGDKAAVEALRVVLAEANVLLDAGKETDASRLVDDIAPKVRSIGYLPLQTEISLVSGSIQKNLGQLQHARSHFRDALIGALRSRQGSEAQVAVTGLISTVGWHQGRVQEARAYASVALGLARKGSIEESDLRNVLADLNARMGLFDDAVRELRTALAVLEELDAPERVLGTRGNLASLLEHLGRLEEAEQEQREVLRGYERLFGRDHPHAIRSINNLAITLKQLGRLEEAEAMYREALALKEKVHGPEHPGVALVLNNLALLLISQERQGEARDLLRRAAAIWEKLPDHPDLADTHDAIGYSFYSEGRYAEALAEYRIVLKLRLELLGPEHPDVASVRLHLATVLQAMENHKGAYEQLRSALSLRERVFGSQSPEVARVRRDLGPVLAALGRLTDAQAELRAALVVLEAEYGSDHAEVVSVRKRLQEISVHDRWSR